MSVNNDTENIREYIFLMEIVTTWWWCLLLLYHLNCLTRFVWSKQGCASEWWSGQAPGSSVRGRVSFRSHSRAFMSSSRVNSGISNSRHRWHNNRRVLQGMRGWVNTYLKSMTALTGSHWDLIVGVQPQDLPAGHDLSTRRGGLHQVGVGASVRTSDSWRARFDSTQF